MPTRCRCSWPQTWRHPRRSSPVPAPRNITTRPLPATAPPPKTSHGGLAAAGVLAAGAAASRAPGPAGLPTGALRAAPGIPRGKRGRGIGPVPTASPRRTGLPAAQPRLTTSAAPRRTPLPAAPAARRATAPGMVASPASPPSRGARLGTPKAERLTAPATSPRPPRRSSRAGLSREGRTLSRAQQRLLFSRYGDAARAFTSTGRYGRLPERVGTRRRAA